jgi:hypothetical protein
VDHARPRTAAVSIGRGWQKPLIVPDHPSYRRQLSRPHKHGHGVGSDRGGVWHKVVAGCMTGSLILVVAACSASVTATRKPVTTSTAPSSRTTSPLATTTTTGPQTFEPAAGSFINDQQGWVLGIIGCQTCIQVETTTDGGNAWSILPPPSVPYRTQAANSVTDIYFADQSNGFLFGPGLEMTHDGGRTWTSGSIPSVVQVLGGGGYAYALSQNVGLSEPPSLWRAPLGSSAWTQLSLPPSAVTGLPAGQSTSYELAVEGQILLLLQEGLGGPLRTATQVGALWSSTDAGASWTSHPVPCSPADGGAVVMSVALNHPDAWLVDCFDNEQSSQELSTQQHLYGTGDAGGHWVRLADPTTTGGPELLADNGSGHAFLATQSGGMDELVGTFDGGVTWSDVLPSTGFQGWADLQFVDASTGFVVVPPGLATANLFRTEDGGQTWTPLQFLSTTTSSTTS